MKNLKRILSFFIVMGFMFVMFGFRVGLKAASFEWDLSIASYSSASEDLVTWTGTYASMTVEKNGSTYAANAYLGGSGTNVQTRIYNSHRLTITPSSGYQITSIAIKCTSSDYATTISGQTWTNATATSNTTTATITPLNTTSAVSVTAPSVIRMTKITITYSTASAEQSINVTGTAYALVGGDTVSLTATPINFASAPESYTWVSSNTNVATVSNTGVVTAVAMGTTNITASANGTTSSAFAIKVYPSNASNISIARAIEIAEFVGTGKTPFLYSSSGIVSNALEKQFTLSDGVNTIIAYNNAGHNLSNGDTVVVTGKITTYNSEAEYTEATFGYTVAFDSNGGSPSYDSLTGIASGTKISTPGNPTKSGYTFTGWFNGNTEWDFENNTVSGPLTLTAHWASNAAQTAINNALEGTDSFMSLSYTYIESSINAPTVYTKATSITHLSAGDSVIIVSKDSSGNFLALNNTLNGNYSNATNITENVVDNIINLVDSSYVWTLGGNAVSGWTLTNDTTQLKCTNNGMSLTTGNGIFKFGSSGNNTFFMYDDKPIIYRVSAEGFKQYALSNLTGNNNDYARETYIFVKQSTAKSSFRDVDFRIRCAIDAGLDILNEDYAVTFGVEVSAGDTTVKYGNNSGASFQTSDGKCFVTLDLGDMLNTNYANLDTEFTVRAYVEYNGAYFYSTNTKTYSVKGMVDYYYNNQHIDAVSGLKEILENYGYTFE